MKHKKKLASTFLMASLLATTPLWLQHPTMTVQAATNQGQEVKLSPAAEKTLQTLYAIQPELKSMTGSRWEAATKATSGLYGGHDFWL